MDDEFKHKLAKKAVFLAISERIWGLFAAYGASLHALSRPQTTAGRLQTFLPLLCSPDGVLSRRRCDRRSGSEREDRMAQGRRGRGRKAEGEERERRGRGTGEGSEEEEEGREGKEEKEEAGGGAGGRGREEARSETIAFVYVFFLSQNLTF